MEMCTRCGGQIFGKFVSKNDVEFHCINGHIIFTKIGETKPSDQDEIDSYLSDNDQLLGTSRVAFILGMTEDSVRELTRRDEWEHVVDGQKRYYRTGYVKELMKRYGIDPKQRQRYAEFSLPANDHPSGGNQPVSTRSYQQEQKA